MRLPYTQNYGAYAWRHRVEEDSLLWSHCSDLAGHWANQGVKLSRLQNFLWKGW